MRALRQRGATTVEMTLVGLPLIFTLISIFEISRGMWMQHTAAYAVRDGVRFATVHGVNCIQNLPGIPNNCPRTVNDILSVIRDGKDPVSGNFLGAGAVGLNPNLTMVTFKSKSVAAFSCHLNGLDGGSCGTTRWPPDNDNAVRSQITLQIQTPFSSALAMFFPGSKPIQFAVVNLWASSTDTMEF